MTLRGLSRPSSLRAIRTGGGSFRGACGLPAKLSNEASRQGGINRLLLGGIVRGEQARFQPCRGVRLAAVNVSAGVDGAERVERGGL